MKNLLLITLLLLSSACATVSKDYTAQTIASYTPGGQLYYQSSKNQEGFKAVTTFEPGTGKLTGLSIETKATTPEAAIAATMETNRAMIETFNKVLEMLEKAGTAAATKGIPVP